MPNATHPHKYVYGNSNRAFTIEESPQDDLDVQIQILYDRLCQRREELRGRVRRVHTDLRRELDPLLTDFADQAIQRSNNAVLSAIGMSAENELVYIQRALQRISEHRYDRCSTCGGHIGLARLEAVPYTEHCVRCAHAAARARQQ